MTGIAGLTLGGGFGSLSPGGRSAGGYRIYEESALERLQQILFYREPGFALEEISTIADDPRTDAIGHLRRQCGASFHRPLVDQAGIRPGYRVLEIGCGTGNLALLAKRLHPDAEVVGLDPDPKTLARARRKAGRKALPVRLDLGFAQELPYPDASFDLVLSALMFHHLGPDEKEKALREVRRVLKPGGSLHLLDFGGAKASSDDFMAHLSHRHGRLRDNFEDRIPTLMREVGPRSHGGGPPGQEGPGTRHVLPRDRAACGVKCRPTRRGSTQIDGEVVP